MLPELVSRCDLEFTIPGLSRIPQFENASLPLRLDRAQNKLAPALPLLIADPDK